MRRLTVSILSGLLVIKWEDDERIKTLWFKSEEHILYYAVRHISISSCCNYHTSFVDVYDIKDAYDIVLGELYSASDEELEDACVYEELKDFFAP